ncbi:hypothetical protein Slin15195_G073450 [Septoria linicola]|uniref:Uncharacterized protein n=1 Tax=Septoria linicola TaxID=215465 RepID=A0A9Q9B0F3_9PEZI|nr:hypothetical protein Slin15195_G073450 [Septoria linicola]
MASSLLDLPRELLEHTFTFVASSSETHAWMFPLREVCREIEGILDRDFTAKCFEHLSVFFLDRKRLESLKRITSEKRIARHIISLTLTLDPYHKAHGDVGDTIDVRLLHGKRQYLEQQYKSFSNSPVMIDLIASILGDLLDVITTRRAWLTLDLYHLTALPKLQVGLLRLTARLIMFAINLSQYPLDRLVMSDQLKLTHDLQTEDYYLDPWLEQMLCGNGLADLTYRADLSSISSQHTADSDAVKEEIFRHHGIFKALEQSPKLHEFAFETAFSTGPWPTFAALTTKLLRANDFGHLGRIHLCDVVCDLRDLLHVLENCRNTLDVAQLIRVVNTSIDHTWHDVFRALQDCPLERLYLSSLFRWNEDDQAHYVLTPQQLDANGGVIAEGEIVEEVTKEDVSEILQTLLDFVGELYIRVERWDVPYRG